ncbi:MAG TPA: hypothetical protein VFD47_11615, partial [Actinomycetota bacterium]|nr:hypothetical protein [Actinomycetota bacterium]
SLTVSAVVAESPHRSAASTGVESTGEGDALVCSVAVAAGLSVREPGDHAAIRTPTTTSRLALRQR